MIDQEKNHKQLTPASGGLLAILGSICWGLSGSVGQYLFSVEGMDSRWLVPIRLGGAGLILLLYSVLRYGPEKLLAPWRNSKHALELLIYGLPGVSACQFFYFLTIQLSTASTATILQDLSPLFVLAVLCITQRRAPNGREIFCIVLALTGVVLLTTHGSIQSLAVTPSAILSGIISAVCVCIYTVAPKTILSCYPVPLLQGWSFLMGGVLLSFVFQPWTYSYVPTVPGLLGIGFVILVGNVLAFVLFMTGVHYAGPQKSNLYSFAEPLTAALVSAVFLGSPFGIWDLTGFLMVFAMMLLLSGHGTKPMGEKR